MSSDEIESLPKNVKSVIESFDIESDPYLESIRIEHDLNNIGWSSEWDLSGDLINVYPKPKNS